MITPIDKAGESKTGELQGITVEGIKTVLGFAANIEDDPDKVENSWGFEYKGRKYGIWDYKGSQHWGVFSTWGDHEGLRELFGGAFKG
jgi:hypothetical protein